MVRVSFRGHPVPWVEWALGVTGAIEAGAGGGGGNASDVGRDDGTASYPPHRPLKQRKEDSSRQTTELRSCVKVEVAVLDSPSLTVRTLSVDVQQHSTIKQRATEMERL